MRILLTVHHALDPRGGAAGVTVQLARGLGALGHETATFSWSDLPAPLGARAREALFPVFVARRIRHGFDVVDASSADAWLWLAARRVAGAERRGPALVTRTHGLDHTFRDARVALARRDGEPIGIPERLYHGFWRRREVEASLRLADAAVFLNRADRDRAVSQLGVDAARAHVLPNGIPDAFLGLPPPPARPPRAPLRLAQVGEWTPLKGAAETAAALGPALAEDAAVELTLLGTGTGSAARVLAAFPEAARPRIRVIERFDRTALPALLADQDVLLQPSHTEGFSLALVEAMACGLAPIASGVGAAPDLLGDGEAGVLVPPGDPAALRAAVAELGRDRAGLERLRAAAHARVQALGWSRIAAATAALYEDLVARRRRR